jgi:predicted thioesterase
LDDGKLGFFSMSQPEGVFRLVSFRPLGGPFQWGFCTIHTDVELKKYPHLKSIRVGEKVWIEGTILSVTHRSIDLEDNAEITFE